MDGCLVIRTTPCRYTNLRFSPSLRSATDPGPYSLLRSTRNSFLILNLFILHPYSCRVRPPVTLVFQSLVFSTPKHCPPSTTGSTSQVQVYVWFNSLRFNPGLTPRSVYDFVELFIKVPRSVSGRT